MRWKVEEEKKESIPRKMGVNDAALSMTNAAMQLQKAQEGLPKQTKKKTYSTSEHKLRVDLEKLGVEDLQIVLDNKGFAVWREMPCKVHRSAGWKILTFLMSEGVAV